MASKVDQTYANAGENVVAGDLNQNTYNNQKTINLAVNVPPVVRPSRIEALKMRLREEIDGNLEVRHTIDGLSRFEKVFAPDGIVGLEAKLAKADRSREYIFAIDEKERFAKLLLKLSRFAAAQEIYAIILAMIEHRHRHLIEPMIGELSKVEINKLVEQEIIIPIVEELGAEELGATHNIIMGMIYWLAERCYVRWH